MKVFLIYLSLLYIFKLLSEVKNKIKNILLNHNLQVILMAHCQILYVQSAPPVAIILLFISNSMAWTRLFSSCPFKVFSLSPVFILNSFTSPSSHPTPNVLPERSIEMQFALDLSQSIDKNYDDIFKSHTFTIPFESQLANLSPFTLNLQPFTEFSWL